MFMAVFSCCLKTWFFHFGRYEVGNVKRRLGVVCVDGFLLCSFPDGPSVREENINLMEERNTCHGTKQILNFKIT